MKDKTLKTLEYDKILRHAGRRGFLGRRQKEKLLGLSPMTDQISVMEALGETTEAVSVIVRKGNAPLGQLYDIDGAMSFAKKGGSLTMKQLLQILYNIRVASNVITFLKRRPSGPAGDRRYQRCSGDLSASGRKHRQMYPF